MYDLKHICLDIKFYFRINIGCQSYTTILKLSSTIFVAFHCSIKDLLQNMGDNFKEDEIRQVWKEAPISGGVFDYDAFVTLIKRGNQEELAA